MATMTLYRSNGEIAEMDTLDARRVLREHPSEWSHAPFVDGKSTSPDPRQHDVTRGPILQGPEQP